MALYGMAAIIKRDPFSQLCAAYEACCRAWGQDPAYRDYKFAIDQAIRHISLLEASPGMRAAMSLPEPTMTGQASPPAAVPAQAESAATDGD